MPVELLSGFAQLGFAVGVAALLLWSLLGRDKKQSDEASIREARLLSRLECLEDELRSTFRMMVVKNQEVLESNNRLLAEFSEATKSRPCLLSKSELRERANS